MKSFSELTSASQVNNGDLLAISQTSGNGYASRKTTVKDITDKSNLNLAEEYDSTSTYAVDDYVIYESALYKCIGTTTGTFDSTKWTSVVVTDEMGGGGTGGHTIIDENGNSMTARAGLQFVGGANVSDDATNNKTIVDLASASGIDGVFIDADNVIYNQFTFDSTAHTWTATEDCILAGNLVALDAYTGAYVWVDNVTCFNTYENTSGNGFYIPIKRGQTITYRAKSGATNNKMSAYGIQTGTTHSKFQPIIYSLEEREIGVWKDGRPLYQKTVDFGALPNDSTKTVSYNISDLDYFVKIQCVAHNQNGSRSIPFVDDAYKSGDVLLDTIKSSGVLRIIAHTDLSNLTGDVTLQYVKSTDTAGSGTWTPQGVPAVHYSTDEQIIGTWLGETFYQKTLHISNVQFDSTGEYDLNLTSMGTDILIADNSCSYYTFSTYVSNFEKLVPEDGHIYCYGLANRPITDGYITIKYTKSS